jgi:hypothetical protein
MLHITFYDEDVDERLRPIPFPRDRAAGRDGESDIVRMVERAFDRVQSDLDCALDLLSDEPLPFPGRDAGDDDGPRAA